MCQVSLGFGFDGFELIDGRTSYSDVKDSKDDSK